MRVVGNQFSGTTRSSQVPCNSGGRAPTSNTGGAGFQGRIPARGRDRRRARLHHRRAAASHPLASMRPPPCQSSRCPSPPRTSLFQRSPPRTTRRWCGPRRPPCGNTWSRGRQCYTRSCRRKVVVVKGPATRAGRGRLI
jgi:hypothetical protein